MSNPAETLYWHLHNLAALPQNEQAWPEGWKKVLEGIEWGEAVGPLLGLIARTEQIVAAHPDIAPGAVLHHKPEWQQAILLHHVNVDRVMSDSGFALTDASNYALYTLAMLINNLPDTTPNTNKDQIDHLAEAVGGLREDVVQSDELDSDLRTFLLDQLSKMQSRIDFVRVTGSGPVEDLVAETIGSGAVHATKWRRAMDTPLRDKIVALFLAFQAIVGTADTTAAAIESTAEHVRGATLVIERVFSDPPKQIEGATAPKALPAGESQP